MKTQYLRSLLVAGCCSLLLSGCSWLEGWPPGKRVAQAPFPEEVIIVKNDGGTWLAPEIEAVGVAGGNIIVPADIAARLHALEAEIVVLRNDMSMMAPALTRLTEMQRDISQVLATMQPAAAQQAGLDSSSAREQVTAVYESASQPQPLTPFRQVPSAESVAQSAQEVTVSVPAGALPSLPVTAPATESVKTIRLGEHADKTRIVLDVTGDIPFQVDLSNSRRELIVNLPGASWQAVQAGAIGGGSVVAGFEARTSAGGTQLALRLNNNSEVLWAHALPGNGSKSPRIVIDLKK